MGSPALQLQKPPLLLQRFHERIPLGTTPGYGSREDQNIHGPPPQYARQPFRFWLGQRWQNQSGAFAGEAQGQQEAEQLEGTRDSEDQRGGVGDSEGLREKDQGWRSGFGGFGDE